MLSMSEQERKELPKPDKFVSERADYTRTDFKCIGDGEIRKFVQRQFGVSTLFEYPVETRDSRFVAMILPRVAENTVEFVDLTLRGRDNLRSGLSTVLRDFKDAKKGRSFLVKAFKLIVEEFQKALAIMELISDESLEDAQDETIEYMRTMLERLRAPPARLFRSVTILRSNSGEDFVRILYAVRTGNDDYPEPLTKCYVPLKPR
jgi:hypothetical protein